MIDHAEAAAGIAELQKRRLSPEEAAAVWAHLEDCRECGHLRDTYELLAGALLSEAASREPHHPSSGRIVAYVLGDESMTAGERTQTGAHLRDCRTCSLEVEATRQATAPPARAHHGSLIPFGSREPVRAAVGWGALAAGIVLLLSYPAYLGLVRLPRAAREAAELKVAQQEGERRIATLEATLEEQRAWSGGAVGTLYLQVDRGGGATGPLLTVRATKGQPLIAILIEPVLPAGAADQDPFRFEIRDRSGAIVWSSDLTAGRIRDYLRDSSHTVTLLVPSNTLAPGDFTLALIDLRAPAPRTLLQVSFEVTE